MSKKSHQGVKLTMLSAHGNSSSPVFIKALTFNFSWTDILKDSQALKPHNPPHTWKEPTGISWIIIYFIYETFI